MLVDFPLDVATARLPANSVTVEMDLPGYRIRPAGHLRQIKKAADAINCAERPLVYAGGGVILSGASAELNELVQKANERTESEMNHTDKLANALEAVLDNDQQIEVAQAHSS